MNSVRYAARPDLVAIRMTNGLTSVFISVLCLAASALAVRDHERARAASLAEHDQGLHGVGTVSFDVSDLPWLSDSLVEDQDFLRRVVAAARARTGWEKLGYMPREAPLQSCLEQFGALVDAFVIASVRGGLPEVQPRTDPKRWVLCPVHQVYEHEDGCVLCHDR